MRHREFGHSPVAYIRRLEGPRARAAPYSDRRATLSSSSRHNRRRSSAWSRRYSGTPDENRKALRRRYAGLYREVEAILFRYDPVGISFEENTAPEEYDPEVSTILPGAWRAASQDEVQ